MEMSIKQAAHDAHRMFPNKTVRVCYEWWVSSDGKGYGKWTLSVLPGFDGSACQRFDGGSPDAAQFLAEVASRGLTADVGGTGGVPDPCPDCPLDCPSGKPCEASPQDCPVE